MTDNNNSDDLYYVNGINASTGKLIEEPLTAAELAARAQRPESAPDPAEANLLRDRDARTTEGSFAPIMGVDERELGETGWGVLLPADADPKILDALKPLLKHRKDKAANLYQEYSGQRGYLPGEKWDSFRKRGDNNIGTGQAVPSEMPYYMLLVGSPAQIPYTFQYNMDVERAVGRIFFDKLDDYRLYAESVVQAETGKLALPKQLSFFATANPDDRATQLSSTDLVTPLSQVLTTELGGKGWSTRSVDPDSASKEALASLMGGANTPALLFTATHGAGFNLGDPRQLRHQGALVTKEYPGPLEWRKPLPESFYFSADDLAANAHLWGMIAVFFACFGAGSPPLSDFYHLRDKLPGEQLQMAAQPFLSALPMNMLCHPNGGALAVVGHVERAWTASFRTPGVSGEKARDLTVFQQMLSLLARGFPVGATLEDMNTRCAQRAVGLASALYPVLNQGLTPTPEIQNEISSLWTTTQDARNYIILGDPAVTLPLAQGDAAPAVRPALESITLTEPAPADEAKENPMSAGNAPSTKTTAVSDPNEPVPFLPLPSVPPNVMAQDPQLYEYWREHVHSGFQRNDKMFRRILDAFLHPYTLVVWLNGILFAIGAGSFVAAVVLSLMTRQVAFSFAFGGMGVLAFLAFFISKPLRSLEENLEFITWLGVVYNTYWNRIVYAMDQDTVQDDLHKINQETVAEIKDLIQSHAMMNGKKTQIKP